MPPRIPNSQPVDSPLCDSRLPKEALEFRMRNSPALVTPKDLGAINVTVWLYTDEEGVERVQVNPNTTIAQLLHQFGPAATPDAKSEYIRNRKRQNGSVQD